MSDVATSRPATSLADRVKTLKIDSAVMERRSGGTTWPLWLLCLLCLGGIGYVGYGQWHLEQDLTARLEKQLTELKETQAAKDAPVSGNTIGPDGMRGAAPVGKIANTAGGYIVPVQLVQVSPKVGGQVTELYIEEGKRVKQGDVLAKLDRAEYEYEYQRTKALADQSKARYDEMRAGNRPEERKRAEATLREAEELREQLRDEAFRYRSSGRAASADDLVKIESRLRQADQRVEQLRQENKMMQEGQRQERIDAAKAEWETACAMRDKAKYYLDNTSVLAPITGTILIKRAEVGNTVRPESFGQGLSASLCDMADLNQLEVDADVSERDLEKVWKGQRCEVRTEAFPDIPYKGYVARMMPTANRGKASVSVRVRVEIPANDSLLRPDMRSRVTFFHDETPNKTK